MINDAHCHFFSSRFLELLAPDTGGGGRDRRQAPVGAAGHADRAGRPLDRRARSPQRRARRADREHSRRRRVGRRSGRAPSAPARRLLHAQPDGPRFRRVLERSLTSFQMQASACSRRCTAIGWTTSASSACSARRRSTAPWSSRTAASLTVGVRKKLGLPSRFDLRLGDPLALARMALGFPQVPVIVPHFGAGFFREALMAADQCPTIHFDTSSSNSWIRFDGGQTLEGVFQQRPRRRRRLASALRHRLVVLPARLAGGHLRRAAADHEFRSA